MLFSMGLWSPCAGFSSPLSLTTLATQIILCLCCSYPALDLILNPRIQCFRSAHELFTEYDASDVKFVPPVPPPSTVSAKKPVGTATRIKSLYFKGYIKQTLSKK